MNTMGKILVFLNLLFALVVGGFLVIDFGMRKNWKDYANQLERELDKARADSAAFRDTREKMHNELAKLHQQLMQKEVEVNALNEDWKKKVAAIEDAKEQLKLATAKFEMNAKLATKENERLGKEAQLLRSQKEKLEGIIVAMEKEADKNFQLYQQALNDRNSVQTRNLALLERNRQLELQLAKKQTGGNGTAASEIADRNGPNPPSFYIKGLIQKVEGTEKNLVEISLGSDHGIKEGHTLEMYRYQPEPEYIGMIRIQSIEPRTAVGRVVRTGVYGTNKNPRAGDEVASKIIPR